MEFDGWGWGEEGEHEGVGFVGGRDSSGFGFVLAFDAELACALEFVAEGGELTCEFGVVGDGDEALGEEVAEMEVAFGAEVGISLGLAACGAGDVDALDGEAEFLEAVEDAGADADFVDDDSVG